MPGAFAEGCARFTLTLTTPNTAAARHTRTLTTAHRTHAESRSGLHPFPFPFPLLFSSQTVCVQQRGRPAQQPDAPAQRPLPALISGRRHAPSCACPAALAPAPKSQARRREHPLASNEPYCPAPQSTPSRPLAATLLPSQPCILILAAPQSSRLTAMSSAHCSVLLPPHAAPALPAPPAPHACCILYPLPLPRQPPASSQLCRN